MEQAMPPEEYDCCRLSGVKALYTHVMDGYIIS
jgi:hypothetical protein